MAALWGAEGWERCECAEVGQAKSGSSVPSILVFTVTGWSRPLLEASFLWSQNLDLGSCVLCDTLEVLPLFPRSPWDYTSSREPPGAGRWCLEKDEQVEAVGEGDKAN